MNFLLFATLIVCVVSEEINVKNEDKNYRKLLKLYKELKEEIVGLKQAQLPVGFIYTQLPNQTAPDLMWPQTKWSDVTKDYAGLFFRAEGGDSMPFGRGVQQANQSFISDINYQAISNLKEVMFNHDIKKNVTKGNWSYIHDRSIDSYSPLIYLSFYTTSAETRPVNTAIRVWKRVQ